MRLSNVLVVNCGRCFTWKPVLWNLGGLLGQQNGEEGLENCGVERVMGLLCD
jgi:hypothetical protein